MAYKPVQTRMLITVQHPERWIAGILIILVAIAMLIWFAYDHGRHVAGFDRAEAFSVTDELQQQLEDAQGQITENQRQAAMLERNNRIDGDASLQLKESLTLAQAEVLELKKELTFYKSIVTPEQTKRSVAIQNIQLKQDEQGGYQYKIMVSQRGQNSSFVRGSIDVSILGNQQGQVTTLKLGSVSREGRKQTTFGFKYFQKFEGTMTLPETFRPDNMRVMVRPRSSRIEPIDEQFAWSDLTAGGIQHVGQQQQN
jgi:hypothetical protein